MIYPINIKPAPRVATGEHKGATITHVGVGERGLEVYTPSTVIKGSADLLPASLRRILGSVLKQAAGSRPGPFIIVPDEIADDKTYDPDSDAPPKDKPEPKEVEYSHPKERRLKQHLGLAPPETETPLEMPKYEKFPLNLPSKHPKEEALKKQTESAVSGASLDPKTKNHLRGVGKAISTTLKSVGMQPTFKIDLVGPGEAQAVILMRGQEDKTQAAMKALKAKKIGQKMQRVGGHIKILLKLPVEGSASVHMGQSGKAVTAATGDIKVKDVEVVSGQFPEDDFDDEGAADVRVEFDIKGKALAQLLGKQARVLEKALKALDSKKALKLLGQGPRNPAIKELFAAVRRPIDKEINAEARDQFNRGAKIDWRGFDFTEGENYWSAKIDPKNGVISYEVEFGVMWKWT